MTKVKQHFVSRFKDGIIINADLSQIEIIAAAQLSGDTALIKLINEGRDVHKFMVANIYNEHEDTISKDDPRRKAAKPGTFGILYGNGAPRLAENTGMSVEWCKTFIETFYKLFPRIKLWHKFLQEQVENNGQFILPTGHILKYRKHPAKYDWQFKQGIVESYNPPDIKNWPVQAFAQNILALWVGNFYREFGNNMIKCLHSMCDNGIIYGTSCEFKCTDCNGSGLVKKYLLINTVHDSLMLDCHQEFLSEAIKDIQLSIDKLPELMLQYFNIKMVVPISVEIKSGKSWTEV